MNFRGDERGQSVVIGTALVFGLLIIGLAGVQAFVVPQQNAAVAANHWDNAQQDMKEIRSVADRVVDKQSSASVSLRLGKRLPDRPFLIEGVPPHGTVETRPVDITINGENFSAPVDANNDTTISPSELGATQDLRYTQSGGDWQTLSSWIGPVSTFVQQDGRISQEVIEDGERIDILILKGNVSVGGIKTENIQLKGIDRSCAAIEGVPGPEITTDRNDAPDQEINWGDDESKQVCFLVVSINNENVDDVPLLTPEIPQTGGSNSTLFNPTRPLVFEKAVEGDNGNQMNITFRNPTTEDVIVTRSRIAAYLEAAPPNNGPYPEEAEYVKFDGSSITSPVLTVPGGSVDVTDMTFGASDTTTVTIEFRDTNEGGSDLDVERDAAVIRFTLDDGTIVRYFVQVPKGGGP